MKLISIPSTLWAVTLFGFKIFLYQRDSDKLKRLSFADSFVRHYKNVLTFQKNYPGNHYRSYIPEGENAEDDFYKEFSKVLGEAKSAIYNSGDGFNMISPPDEGGGMSSREKADKLDGAIIHAMKKNPRLICKRFQILSACNINWISRLIALKQDEDLGDRFQVYTNRHFDHMGCFCAIDPKSDNCVFEWQLVSGRHYIRGTMSKGFGFIYENNNICAVVAKMFDDQLNDAPATNLLKGEHIKVDTSTGLSVRRLELLQEELWNNRVRRVHEDPNHNIGDPEIKNAFKERRLDQTNFEMSDMDFRRAEFPPIPYTQ